MLAEVIQFLSCTIFHVALGLFEFMALFLGAICSGFKYGSKKLIIKRHIQLRKIFTCKIKKMCQCTIIRLIEDTPFLGLIFETSEET